MWRSLGGLLTLAVALSMVFSPTAQAKKGEVELEGVVTSLPSGTLIGDWVVDGKTVHVSSLTRIKPKGAQVQTGDSVEVKGIKRQDGSIDATKIELEDDDDDEREVELKGTVQALPPSGLIGDWTVNGRTVHVSAETKIKQKDGPVAVGDPVEVEGTLRQDGSIDAKKIEAEKNEIELKGIVESFPPGGGVGDWVISGKTVHVSAATKLKLKGGAPVVGDEAEVEGTLRQDGSIDARKLEVEHEDEDDEDDEDEFEFEGLVEVMPLGSPVGDWTIGGKVVRVTTETQLIEKHGPILVGTLVEVEGIRLQDGTLIAEKIKSEEPEDEDEFKGLIEALPVGGLIGDWIIGGKTVHVTPSTEIDQEHGTIAVGVLVEVEGTANADGTFTATEIEVEDD